MGSSFSVPVEVTSGWGHMAHLGGEHQDLPESLSMRMVSLGVTGAGVWSSTGVDRTWGGAVGSQHLRPYREARHR